MAPAEPDREIARIPLQDVLSVSTVSRAPRASGEPAARAPGRQPRERDTLVLDTGKGSNRTLDDLVRVAHRVCPYSNATRNNIEVTLTANGQAVS